MGQVRYGPLIILERLSSVSGAARLGLTCFVE